MELTQVPTGSLLWAALFSFGLLAAGGAAAHVLAGKSGLLKPVASGLRLISLFVALQAFLLLGANDHLPRLSPYLNFSSWILFSFAVLRLALYLYGDLFVVRWKKGSFPAAFKSIITAAVIVVVALLLLKELLQINVTSMIATTTVLTATIGLAFQSTLANMLAGLTIHLEKPLRQGDWVSAGGHEGRVLDITLRSTRIMTMEHNEVFIPNSRVLSEAVVNYSLPDSITLRKLSIGVSYRVPPNTVRKAILEAVAAVPGVERDPAPLVRVVNYGDFSVHYEIRYAVREYGRHPDIGAEIMNLLWYRLKRDNIEIPFPIQSVQVQEVTPESQRAEREQMVEETLSLMEKVDILSPLSRDERRRLVEAVGVKSFAAGERPVRQGEPGDTCYVIKRGTVQVIVERKRGTARWSPRSDRGPSSEK